METEEEHDRAVREFTDSLEMMTPDERNKHKDNILRYMAVSGIFMVRLCDGTVYTVGKA